MQEAEALLSSKKFGEAFDLLVKLNDKTDVHIASLLGQALAGLGRWQEASDAFRRAATICEQNQSIQAQKPKAESKNTEDELPTVLDESPLAKPKYDWYQSSSHVFVSISCKNTSPKDLSIVYSQGGTNMTVTVAGRYRLELSLFASVDPSASTHVLTNYKIELKLAKVFQGNWTNLEASAVRVSTENATALPKPYASKKSQQDWDRLAKDAIDDKEDEGGDALNGLLKKIYKDSDEDTRRAMIKSFQTSGGTVLTTNWKDAAEKDFAQDIKPPKGQVFKSWEGDVISKDDEE